MNRRAIAADLGRKIGDTMKETMRREMTIAQHVLEPAEIMLIMMMCAKGALGSAAATIAGAAAPEDRERIYNDAIAQIVGLTRAEWPAAEREIEQRYAAATAS